jgi:hypothetical protein
MDCKFFFANRTLVLKETMNSIKHPKKNDIKTRSLRALHLQPLDHVNDAPSLPLKLQLKKKYLDRCICFAVRAKLEITHELQLDCN